VETPSTAGRDQNERVGDPNRKPGADATGDLPLTKEETDNVAGGRDPGTGLPTGQRMHKPASLDPTGS
jgi:hypothetical protein